jgi:hypothetical protein
LAFCLILTFKSDAQVLYDDFNSTAINTNFWSVYLPPDGNPSATENSGNAILITGATLITVSNFPNATVNGSFQITGDNDSRFNIMLRTDGTSFDPHWEMPSNGILIQFSTTSNPTPNNPSLQIVDQTSGVTLGSASP